MFKSAVSSFLKQAVITSGLLPRWEDRITPWPRVLLYHQISDPRVPFLADNVVESRVFAEHIAALRKRYHFLSWSEYKEAVTSRRENKRSILLTFDDGFQRSWLTASQLAEEGGIPAVFFVNTRVLDNAYTPWNVQYYFLRSQANPSSLDPLWKSISHGKALSSPAARRCMHENFSLSGVVGPIEEGLAKAGMTPTDLAQQYGLYLSSLDLRQRSSLLEIGNHSHSHFILSKLTDEKLEEELRLSHGILAKVLQRNVECFAYPFGIPEQHFDNRCEQALRQVGPYSYIFSAEDTLVRGNHFGRICLDKITPRDLVGAVAKVTPRALGKFLLAK